MNILFLSHLFPDNIYTSFGTFVHERTKYLSKNCNINIVSPRPYVIPLKFLGEWYKYSLISKNIDFKFTKAYYPRYVTFPRKFLFSLEGLSYYFFSRKIIPKFNFDIIHAHQPYPDGYAGYLLKKKYKKPLIITIHDGYLGLLEKNILWKYMTRKALDDADRIIIVADYLKEECKKFGIKNLDKIVKIPNGFNHKTFFPMEKDTTRKKLNLSRNKKIILFVGAIYPPKGLPYLIDAIKILVKARQDFEVILVGCGESVGGKKLKAKLESKVKNLNLEEYIKFVGAKPHEEIPLWMNACDVFVLPSIAEGFPTVLPEVLACGKPVVATEVGGIPEIINESVGILVEPKKPEEIAGALNKALGKKWDHKKIVEYSKKFTWEEISKKILNVYEEVLK